MITASSTPNYDEWGWDDYWNCEDWLQWHRALKAAHGLDAANYTFITAYHQASFGAASFDCRTFNSAFREYARQNGFHDALYLGIGAIMQPVGDVLETGGNIIGSALSASETLKKLIPIMMILAAIILLVYLSKKAQLV